MNCLDVCLGFETEAKVIFVVIVSSEQEKMVQGSNELVQLQMVLVVGR